MSDTPDRLVYSAGKLPARANLEHLKNEAKQRLKTMRSQTPGARLSEAQLLVARSYGFSSWRKLKSHVDALHDFGQQLVNAVHANDLAAIRKVLDRHPELNALDEAEAFLQTGKIAESYFPARPIGPKKLEQTIQILRSRRAQESGASNPGRRTVHFVRTFVRI